MSTCTGMKIQMGYLSDAQHVKYINFFSFFPFNKPSVHSSRMWTEPHTGQLKNDKLILFRCCTYAVLFIYLAIFCDKQLTAWVPICITRIRQPTEPSSFGEYTMHARTHATGLPQKVRVICESFNKADCLAFTNDASESTDSKRSSQAYISWRHVLRIAAVEAPTIFFKIWIYDFCSARIEHFFQKIHPNFTYAEANMNSS